ncbi:MAG TPA: CGNR zinc finger domain-containing protein [Micromonosporaceae bacterium]|jgi:predicted RNA-binding Zn ribbon-like protein|nr:CGNR zinc finger domain-containing protein [Micromonosporaceae bacterium]
MASDIPTALWFVESLLNSIDVESGEDDFDSVPRFQRWLANHDRGTAVERASADDLELARAIRTELRNLAAAHAEQAASTDTGRLDALAARVPLRAMFGGETIGLAPAVDGVPGVLGEVLAAVVIAGQDGSWRRLKLCREGTCQVVFYDRSKNASRCWCSMQVCGNRNKTRAYRRRVSPPAAMSARAATAAGRRKQVG